MSADMKTNYVNRQQLIAAVKKHPCIWDSMCPEYQYKKEKRSAWLAVASDVIDGWNEFTRTEQHSAVLVLTRRWNNIRDYFNKSLKAARHAKLRGEPYNKPKYIFADALKFMIPELERNIDRRRPTEPKLAAELEEDDSSFVEEEQDEECNDIKFVDTLYVAEQISRIKQESVEYDSVPVQSSNISKQDEDHDLMFLKSLLPDMKKLQDDEKFEFKYAIMTAYSDIVKKRKQTE